MRGKKSIVYEDVVKIMAFLRKSDAAEQAVLE
jgi:hypothetical protein